MNIVYSISGAAIANRVSFLKEGGSYVAVAFKCEYGSGGIRIEDPAGNLDIAGWETFWVDDLDASPTRVWTGYIFDKSLSRGELPPTGVNRVHDCDIIDGNAALQFQVLHSNDAKRPAETDVDRVNWLLTSEAITGYGSLLVEDLGLVSAADPVSFLDKDCRGSFANSVLRTLCDIAQKNAFGYIDDYTGLAGLFYGKDDSAAYSSDIRISNVIADVDGTETFYPDTDARLKQSGNERFGGVLFNWQGAPIYAQSPSTIAAMGGVVRDAIVSDDKQIGDAATAATEAASFLNTHANEADTITVTILMPSESVNLLYAGMRMEVKFTHLPGYESFTWTRVRSKGVRTKGVDVAGTWTVLWQVDLELWVPPVPVDDAEPVGGGGGAAGCGEGDGSGAVAIRQSKVGASGLIAGPTMTITLDSPPLAGSLLLLATITRSGGGGEPSDDAGEGWSGTALGAGFVEEGTNGWGRFYAKCCIGAADQTQVWSVEQHDAVLYELTGAALAPTEVLSVTLQADNMTHLIGTFGSFPAGSMAFMLLLSDYIGEFGIYQPNAWTVDADAGSSHAPGTWQPHHYMAHTTSETVAGAGLYDVPKKYGGMAVLFGPGAAPLPQVGDPVGPTPVVGDVDGVNTDFETTLPGDVTPAPFLPGTLVFLHDGTDQTAHVTTSDPTAGTFTLDYAPSFGSTLRTRYESA